MLPAPATPDVMLQRLAQVSVAARRAVESLLTGQHRSVRRGLSVEFAGHRPYQPGDDLRRLDWTVYARTDRYDVRQHEEEARLYATLVIDASGSMGYGLPGRSKLDYARTLAAAIGFLLVRRGDAVGLATVDHAVREHLPPTATMGGLLTMLDRLRATRAGGETSLGDVLHDLAPRFTRRGLVFLLSDAFDDADRLVRALRLLRHRKQDARLLQIIDADEDDFPLSGMVAFAGLESEPLRAVDSDRIRPWYRRARADHRARLAAGCHAAGVPVATLRTDEDPTLALLRVLTQGAAR